MRIWTNPPVISRTIKAVALLGTLGTVGISGQLSAQEDPSLLNTVLDIDELYTEVVSEPVHGTTAAALIEELQTKHYATVEID
ncbi:MAG: hypothetical protein ACE37N_11450, partial [Pseudohongiellaceae bacterium]